MNQNTYLSEKYRDRFHDFIGMYIILSFYIVHLYLFDEIILECNKKQ